MVLIYLLLAILIFLSGWGLIRTKALEILYLQYLRDKRYKKSKWDIFKEWGLYIIYIILGAIIVYLGIVYLGMDIWKQIVLSA